MEYRTLGRTGVRVSVVGFGASPLGDEFGSISSLEAGKAVHAAIEGGINFFDVAPYYGRTLAETRLGAALAGRRDEVILATKFGRYEKNLFDFSTARLKTSVEESLRRLRTDRVDLLTAHDIEFGEREQIVNQTIPAMRELQRQGKARFIGISGLPLKMLADVAQRTNVDTVLSYCHYNLLARDLDQWLTPFAKERNIGLINASPLHMRILTAAGPPAWHPAPSAVKRAGAEVVELCRRRGVDPSVIALRFCLDHKDVSTTLVGMSNAIEVERNIGALEIETDAELLAEIDGIVAPIRDLTWASGSPENSDV